MFCAIIGILSKNWRHDDSVSFFGMRMKHQIVNVTTVGIVFLLCTASIALAGFGISPPYVSNDSLTRGSIYEQEIFLVRGDPINDLKAEIVFNIPGIEDWFTVDRGNEFILPRGETKIPMKITVRVPDKADFKQYTGNIRVRTSPVDNVNPGGGSVSIALGAQIDVNISVVDEKILDFRVRRIGISDLNEGRFIKWLHFPGKISFSMTIENIGNADVAPSRVTFDIYDTKGEELLEQTQSTNRIEKIEPFDTKEVIAELPTKLPASAYLARYRIFNGDEVIQEGELNVSILPYGTVTAAGYGFSGLSSSHKAIIVVPILLLLIISVLLFGRIGKRSKQRRRKNRA